MSPRSATRCRSSDPLAILTAPFGQDQRQVRLPRLHEVFPPLYALIVLLAALRPNVDEVTAVPHSGRVVVGLLRRHTLELDEAVDQRIDGVIATDSRVLPGHIPLPPLPHDDATRLDKLCRKGARGLSDGAEG
eukprot:5254963-Prymnesium_polylepis.1